MRAENLGKRYRLQGAGGRPSYSTIRESLMGLVGAPVKRLRPPSRDTVDRELWALRDVSFNVVDGEVLGIIGRNGAGKSTLLKILARITEPTTGYADVYGRVGALLEVGTGFHAELSGRENIYLNGAILGMSRTDIQRRFDEIVAFAELDRFLETPVKRYSSGMYMRLAFSVAAHLEPEVLVIDEVLAVGDAGFQAKCLGKMSEVAREGRTVLFVSHNMSAVERLCSSAILLEQGQIVHSGTVDAVINKYLQSVGQSLRNLRDEVNRQGTGALRFVDFEIRDLAGLPLSHAKTGQTIDLCIRYQVQHPATRVHRLHVAVGVHGAHDEPLFHLATATVPPGDFVDPPRAGWATCRIEHLPLLPGVYGLNFFAVADGEIADWIQSAAVITVDATDFFGTGRLPPPDQGMFAVGHRWRAESATT
ncbi:MAG: ABC transporter ATP-binding protein [Chloroflexota bacterium]